jgi:hypothetical protein
MERKIKFRAIRTDGKGWVYGDLVRKEGKTFVGRNLLHRKVGRGNVLIYIETEVIAETVGQFTGIVGMNDKEIWEEDRVSDEQSSFEVKWHTQSAKRWLECSESSKAKKIDGFWVMQLQSHALGDGYMKRRDL